MTHSIPPTPNGEKIVTTGGRIQIGNRFYRMRRGKMVEIPPEWVGQVTNPQTIRNRKKDAKAKAHRARARRAPS